MLRDADLIRERWVRHFHSLLNAKSETLDPTVISKIPQRPVAGALGKSQRRMKLPLLCGQWQIRRQLDRTVFERSC